MFFKLFPRGYIGLKGIITHQWYFINSHRNRTLVVTTDSLDFDLGVEVYTLKVTVNDSVHEDLLEVVVSVQDINDNFPNFIISSYEFFVEENLNASAFVGQVQAIDIDSGLFGMVTYRLSGVGAERYVHIHVDAHLSLTNAMDHLITITSFWGKSERRRSCMNWLLMSHLCSDVI